MKVYVASKFQNREKARLVMDLLEDRGHTITHDWTKQEEPYNHQDEGAPKRQEADLIGVRRCDLLLLIGHEGLTGALVEFGAALALAKPIVVLDKQAHYTTFFENPRVVCLDQLGEALNMIDLLESRTGVTRA